VNKIVIPIYKNWGLCQSLLNDLRKNEKGNIGEIYVVDDCSNDAEVDGGLDFWTQVNLIPVTVLRNEENLGFTLSSIRGLHYACSRSKDDDVVYLISSDVRINSKFLDASSQIAISQKALVGHRLLSGNTGWNSFDGKVYPYLEGYFLACTAKGWMDLEYFDPSYAPHDFEDVDLSTKAVSLGYKLIPLNNPMISHLGGRSIGFGQERETVTDRNREYFRKKWVNE